MTGGDFDDTSPLLVSWFSNEFVNGNEFTDFTALFAFTVVVPVADGTD